MTHVGVALHSSTSGTGAADAAFLADAVVTKILMDHEHPNIDHRVLAATNAFTIVEDLLGGRRDAMVWWSTRPASAVAADQRLVGDVTAMLVGDQLWSLLDEKHAIAEAWLRRGEALAAWRAFTDVDSVLDLLMSSHGRHHACDEAVRLVAMSWRAERRRD